MKLLQRQEMKEATIFFNKITAEREAHDKKLETEQQVD
jgi:serine/threonine-protein kinase 10